MILKCYLKDLNKIKSIIKVTNNSNLFHQAKSCPNKCKASPASKSSSHKTRNTSCNSTSHSSVASKSKTKPSSSSSHKTYRTFPSLWTEATSHTPSWPCGIRALSKSRRPFTPTHTWECWILGSIRWGRSLRWRSSSLLWRLTWRIICWLMSGFWWLLRLFPTWRKSTSREIKSLLLRHLTCPIWCMLTSITTRYCRLMTLKDIPKSKC